jgi:hypothetical protein
VAISMASLGEPETEQGLGTTLVPLRLEYLKELIRQGDAGRAAWQAFHAGARFAYSGLWRHARRAMRSQEGAGKGGRSKLDYRELSPEEVHRVVAALRKQSPRLRMEDIDRTAARKLGIGARTVRRYRSETSNGARRVKGTSVRSGP